MTRALITGIGGFVASHLAEFLVQHTDWDVYGTLRVIEPTDNLHNLIPWINGRKRVYTINADLNDAGSLRTVMRQVHPDYVFHLAAQGFPGSSFSAASETLQTNIIGTLNVIEAVKEHVPNALVHVCSSSEVYGRVLSDQLPIKEDCRFAPASPYSVSKCGADMIGKLYADAYGLNIMITRMFTHTGYRRSDIFAESSFAKQIAMFEIGKVKEIKVGNLNSLRTIADVRDAVRAYYLLLTVNPQPGEIYNIGGDHVCTIGDVLHTLMRLANVDCPVVEDKARLRPVDADLQVPDCTKFKEHTGWGPMIPFEETMQSLLDYWRMKVRTGEYLVR